MEKDKFQPIVMPCTKEQYESLIPVLEEHLHKNNSLIEYHLNDHGIYSMKSITNNHTCKKGFVSFNTLGINDYFHIHKGKRKVYKRFNRKIFLKSLGIIEEPEFVLPEKWTIKRTPETDVLITNYFRKLHDRNYLYNNPSQYLYHDQKRKDGYSHCVIMDGYEEITYEQFLKYVLKEKFVLPKKWCVRINNENHNIISEYRSKIHYYSLTASRKGFMHSNGLITEFNTNLKNVENSIEITFEQFQKYVLKQEISISESQSVTNKQANTMVKITVEESQPKEKIHRGCLVKWKDIIAIATLTKGNYIEIMSLSKGIGTMYNINIDIEKVSLFKGKLTLEQ